MQTFDADLRVIAKYVCIEYANAHLMQNECV